MDLNINGVPIVVPETTVADIVRRHLLGNGHADEIATEGIASAACGRAVDAAVLLRGGHGHLIY